MTQPLRRLVTDHQRFDAPSATTGWQNGNVKKTLQQKINMWHQRLKQLPKKILSKKWYKVYKFQKQHQMKVSMMISGAKLLVFRECIYNLLPLNGSPFSHTWHRGDVHGALVFCYFICCLSVTRFVIHFQRWKRFHGVKNKRT